MSQIIPESIVHTTDNRGKATLRFTVRAANGDRVDFPVPFKTDRVTVTIPNHYNGDKFITAGYTGQAVKDRYGFSVSRLAHNEGQTPIWDNSDSPLDVLAVEY